MKVFILTLLLICCAYSQSDYWYEARIFKVNNGYDVPYTVLDDDSLRTTLVEDTVNPRYVSPYTSYLWRIDTVSVEGRWWIVDSIIIVSPLDYPQGVYEITYHQAVYLDSFWVMIDTVHTMLLDSLAYGHSTNARYVGIDTTDSPLPIELNFFEIVLINGDVVATWITQSELQNCAFNLYRKEHGKSEELIFTAAGQGSTSASTTYGYTDSKVLQGRSYTYRLESVSCGGVHETEGQFLIFVPVEYGLTLYQNYPNPANPTTTIKFKIDEPSHVKLFVYDINGRKSATIIEEKMNSGEHEVGVDLSNIASGTYFYVLKAHNTRTNAIRMLSKKMTVLK